ncbi:hypothetical protein HK407_02g04840 [Ordospora pajunii]|uniref:uncharacterized protein n=1 Tax=Ordospora pajunii TaxID=3039483 RepID=UPI0029527C21|nr:uncharacterized protein HK407_02g04840 [Ordospora pajunii]KAH9412035.1 hypothetical protein HK407_02g04840 [Ordospora pajunii]
MSAKDGSSKKEMLENEIKQYEVLLNTKVEEKNLLRKEELKRLPRKIYRLREEIFEMEYAHAIEMENINQEIEKLNGEHSNIAWSIWNNKCSIDQLTTKHKNMASVCMTDLERSMNNISYIRDLADLNQKDGNYNLQLRELSRQINEKKNEMQNKKIKYNTKVQHKNERIKSEEKHYISESELVKIYDIRTKQKDVEREINALIVDIRNKKAELVSEIQWKWMKWIGMILLYVFCTLVVITLLYIAVKSIANSTSSPQGVPQKSPNTQSRHSNYSFQDQESVNSKYTPSAPPFHHQDDNPLLHHQDKNPPSYRSIFPEKFRLNS